MKKTCTNCRHLFIKDFVYGFCGLDDAHVSSTHHCRKWRKRGDKTKRTLDKVIKWILIWAFTIFCFIEGARMAMEIRGYHAVGAEIFILFIPIIYYILETSWRRRK